MYSSLKSVFCLLYNELFKHVPSPVRVDKKILMTSYNFLNYHYTYILKGRSICVSFEYITNIYRKFTPLILLERRNIVEPNQQQSVNFCPLFHHISNKSHQNCKRTVTSSRKLEPSFSRQETRVDVEKWLRLKTDA